MTLCPGCNHGILEPLTPGLRAALNINDGTIRSTCTADCGTVAREFAPVTRVDASRTRTSREATSTAFCGE